MARQFYYGKEADIVTGSANFAARVGTTPGSFGVPAERVAGFVALDAALQAAYRKAAEPGTRSPVAIRGKDHAITAMRTAAIQLTHLIYGTRSVTDSDLINLGLLPRRTYTRVPAPSVRPGVRIGPVNGRTLSVKLYDLESGRPRKAARTVAALLYSFVGENYPADPKAWKFHRATSRTACELVFPNDLPAGTRVWICAAWVNGKQQLGPRSTPVMTYLQGGGVSKPNPLRLVA
jgi:hypothetical protein